MCSSNCNKFENVQCLRSHGYVGFHFLGKSGAVGEGQFMTEATGRDKPALGISSTGVMGGRGGTTEEREDGIAAGARGRSPLLYKYDFQVTSLAYYLGVLGISDTWRNVI